MVPYPKTNIVYYIHVEYGRWKLFSTIMFCVSTACSLTYPGNTMLFFKLQWITVDMNMLLI